MMVQEWGHANLTSSLILVLFLKGDFMPRVYFLPSLFFFDGGDPTVKTPKRLRFRMSKKRGESRGHPDVGRLDDGQSIRRGERLGG